MASHRKNESRLDSKTRKRLNEVLSSKGFDGNGRFESPREGFRQLCSLLGYYGDIEPAGNENFLGASGRKTFDLVRQPRNADFQTSQSIANSMLVFSWYELVPGRYEILAYLS